MMHILAKHKTLSLSVHAVRVRRADSGDTFCTKTTRHFLFTSSSSFQRMLIVLLLLFLMLLLSLLVLILLALCILAILDGVVQ